MTNQPKFLQRYCENAIAILNSQYAATKILKHHATAVAAREQIIKDFLSDHLPALITVMSGQIVDADDNYSRQQDIVLVLKSMPRLQFASGSGLIFQEGVVATIEIKTALDIATLKSIGDNIASVRSLHPNISMPTQVGVTHNWPSNKMLTVIITYGGTSLEALAEPLFSLPDTSKPDLFLDLSKGLLIRNNGLLLPKQSAHEYALVNNPAEGFKLFLTFLTEITDTASSRGVMWRQYW